MFQLTWNHGPRLKQRYDRPVCQIETDIRQTDIHLSWLPLSPSCA